MRVEWSVVEPDIACSGALLLPTSGLVWHCPFVGTVKLSYRLLLTSKHYDDMSHAMSLAGTVSWSNYHLFYFMMPDFSSKRLFGLIASTDSISALFGNFISVTSLPYLTYFLWDSSEKRCFSVRMFFCQSFFNPGCVIDVFALSWWWGSSVYFSFFLKPHSCADTKFPCQ